MVTIIVVAIALVSLSLMAWELARAYAQQRLIGARIEDLVLNLTATSASDRSPRPDTLEGERAPGFELPTLAGERLSLQALLTAGKPVMLVFADPRCGPCYEILPDIGGWQRVYGDRLTIVLVSNGDPRPNTAMTAGYGIDPLLLQHDLEVVNAYGLVQGPAAVLIQPDGRISAGPRYGTRAIRQLVANTLGMILPPAPTSEITSVSVGEAIPHLRRPDLRGNVIDLGVPGGVPILLLFWSPGCSHCQKLLPMILAAEQQASWPGMIIVSRGPVGLTEDAGFRSPVLFDDDRSIARTLGVEATPSAVVVDGQGRVASPVIRGGPGVLGVLKRFASATAEGTPQTSTHAPHPHQPDLVGKA